MTFKKGNRHGAKMKSLIWKPNLTMQILLSELKREGLPKPELEHRFHPIRKWRFDAALVDQKIAVEIEGGIWIKGRHSRGAGMQADMEKYNEAVCMGWRVLRYSTGQVKQGIPIVDLKRLICTSL